MIIARGSLVFCGLRQSEVIRERCFEVWIIDFEKDGVSLVWSESSGYEKIEGLTGCFEYCACFDACLPAGLLVS